MAATCVAGICGNISSIRRTICIFGSSSDSGNHTTLEVLDPNADPMGKPAVKLVRDDDGQLRVDIPPTALVHKYYYSGDRSFQAALLPGGPTVVVANHPKTGERCYIDVQTIPGAPRVTYTGHSIEYDYGQQGICIHFGFFGPRVVYRNGPGWRQHLERVKTAAAETKDVLIEKTGLHQHAKDVAAGSTNLVKAGARGVNQATQVVTQPVKQIVARTPFGNILKPPSEAEAEQARAGSVELAEKRATELEATIRTVR